MGELTTLSQTPESDEEGVQFLPIHLLSRLGTQGHLVLILNWYPHFLDQSFTILSAASGKGRLKVPSVSIFRA